MNEISVRPFANRDAHEVARILFESYKTFLGNRLTAPEPDEYYCHAAASPETCALVAEIDGKVVGVIAILVQKRLGLGVLDVIGVDPAFQSRGVGSALYGEAEAIWQAEGMRKISLCASEINPKVRAFCEKRGFREEARLKDHYYRGVDEIEMAKFL